MRRHPEAGYLSDLGMLRRFVRNGSFGYREPDNVVFQTLTVPGGVLGFRQRAEKEVLERYARSPYVEDHMRIYPNTPDKNGYLRSLESPEAFESFEAELGNP